MSSTPRAFKRRKLNSSSPAPHVALLTRLNQLEPDAFRDKYIPSDLLTFNPPNCPSESLTINFYSAADLPNNDYRGCFELLRHTSEAHYRASTSRPWNPTQKRAEMKDMDMKYLIVRRLCEESTQSTSGTNDSTSLSVAASRVQPTEETLQNFGFLSFKLDEDETADSTVNVPVLYVYEIHLGSRLRGLGIGKHLMYITKHTAQETGMAKVILSVFTVNRAAEGFYRSLGYVTDETSPPTKTLRGKVVESEDWQALSLPLKIGETVHSSIKARKPPKRAVLQHISDRSGSNKEHSSKSDT